MKFPITTVHQIELSSRCNLRCKYCPHPKLQRDKADMDWHTFGAAIYWAVRLGGPELSLTGMGESVLHPEFPVMLRYARQELPDTMLLLASNGVEISDEALQAIKDTGALLFLSPHRPEVLGKVVERGLKMGVHMEVNQRVVTSGFDWAGQVSWPTLAQRHECQYLAQGWATVLQDGSVVNCCMDAHGLHPCGTVFDPPTHFEAIPLCEQCHLTVPEQAQEVA